MSDSKMTVEDMQKKIDELQRERQRFLSEEGRLKKEQQLRAEAEANAAALKAQFDELKAKQETDIIKQKGVEALSGTMGEEAAGSVLAFINQVRSEGAKSESMVKEFIDGMRKERLEAEYNRAMSNLDAAYGGGVVNKIEPGGEFHDSWMEFKSLRPSVAMAEQARDANAMRDFMEVFLQTKNVQRNPVATPGQGGGGGLPYGNQPRGPIYTDEHFVADLNALDKALTSRDITREEYDESYKVVMAKWEETLKGR